ncbi:hypothetical protein IHE45_15G065300 [Dioscorea alata]|uniref:Uncharacterized protein n=1 Tax=Dioscorea alata TaxID=55571 RepID=A0ACB7UM14_DIOAL|nr:hypothetical protein IHE45_15G065300 [Dioscorea alata]
MPTMYHSYLPGSPWGHLPKGWVGERSITSKRNDISGEGSGPMTPLKANDMSGGGGSNLLDEHQPKSCGGGRFTSKPNDISGEGSGSMTPLKANDMSGGGGSNLPDEHRIDIDDRDATWIKTVRSSANMQPGRRQGGSSRPCTIFKIQDSIRLGNEEAYRPLVVSIGPYYHNRLPTSNSHVIALENHKWFCLRRLLFRNRSRRNATKLLDKCLLAMKALDAKVRSCYSEELDNLTDDHSLALVMLLDGCFILHLLLFQQEHKQCAENPPTDIKDDEGDEVGEQGEILSAPGEEEELQWPLLGMLWIWNVVRYDLLKLENQIPFFILITLFDLLKTSGDENVDLVRLALKLFIEMHPLNSQTSPVLPTPNQVHHLLHLFHSNFVPSKNQQPLDTTRAQKAPEWIPNATELQQAGVKFVKKKDAHSILDISFSSNGIMKIPQLCLYDDTDTLFRNMIAFEQCYPYTQTYITIYALFMDCVIDTPNDVRLLHLKAILSNRLSTDEAAAELFNKLCYQVHYALDKNYLHELFANVNKYYQSRWNQWRSKLMRDYFSNPWSILSMIAAVVLLLLTFEQSFFTAFSYFRPT